MPCGVLNSYDVTGVAVSVQTEAGAHWDAGNILYLDCLTLKGEALRSSETLVTIYQSIRQNKNTERLVSSSTPL